MLKRKSKFFTKEEVEIALSNGICYDTLKYRIKRGWDKQKAITEKPRPKNIDWENCEFVAYKGEDMLAIGNVFEIAEELGVSVNACKGYYHKTKQGINKGNATTLTFVGMKGDEDEDEDDWNE